MNKNIFKKVACGLSFSLLLLSAASVSYAENNVTILKNGLRVLVVEDSRFPLASVRLYVHAGGAYEESDKAGMSHLLEHMVFRGTKKRPDGALAEEIEHVGGDFNAYTSSDETVYYTNLPSSEWKRGVDIVADMAFNPIIDPKIMEEEKEVIYAEMSQRRESPEMRIYEDSIALALENTSYEHGVLGTVETVASITAKDINNYMDKLYNPQNMLLVVVGDVKRSEVIKEAEKYFGSKKNEQNLVFPSALELPLFEGAKLQIEENNTSKILLNITFPTPSVFDESTRNLDLFSLIFGGLDTSLLDKKFKTDTNLVNSIGSYNIAYNGVSLFTISVDLEAENVKKFWKEFVKTLAELSMEQFTEEQLETVKFLYETSFQRRKSTIESYAQLVGDSEFSSPGEFSLANYLNSVEQVSLESIQESIDAWINPSNMAINVLAPKDVIESGSLPNFLEIVKNEWQVADEKMATSSMQKLDKSLLPENVKVLEETEERIVLEYAKGSTVILLPDNTMPFFTAKLKYDGGNSLLQLDEQGLSYAMSTILTEATEKMDQEEFSEYLLKRAIGLSASSTRESFELSLDAPTQFEKEAFAQLADIINKPAFDKNDWKRIKTDLLTTVRDRDENPQSLLFTEFMPLLYAGNAYSYKSLGTAETVEAMNLSDVKKLWKEQKNQAWVLTVAGDFDADSVIEFANKLKVNDNEIQLLEAPTLNAFQTKKLELPQTHQAYVLQMFRAVPYTHEDEAALELLESILGDMSGILFTEVRDKKGLAYSVSPFLINTSEVGVLAFYASTDLKNEDKILPAFEEVVLDLQNKPLPKDIIEAAKVKIEAQYIKGKQSLESRASEATTNKFLGRSFDYQEKMIEEIKKVDAKAIQAVAKKYLNPENSSVLIVTSEKE